MHPIIPRSEIQFVNNLLFVHVAETLNSLRWLGDKSLMG